MHSGVLSAAALRMVSEIWRIASSTSEPRQFGKLLLSAPDVHRAELSAAMQGRHRLAGIQQPAFVERFLHCVKGLQLAGAELQAHLVDFLDTDAVFAGD